MSDAPARVPRGHRVTGLGRRGALGKILGGLLGAALPATIIHNAGAQDVDAGPAPRGPLKQSVCRWPYQTLGVPGRHEIDATQELNYRAIAIAIADLGYTGFVAHEFTPTHHDPYTSLADAFRICTV